MLTEKSNDLLGNRNRDLPACSTVPHVRRNVKILSARQTRLSHSDVYSKSVRPRISEEAVAILTEDFIDFQVQ
jgi:hypothetical protein